MAEIIELKNVIFSAQEGNIIDDVSFKFKMSKTTAIVGPSGGGKSTVLKLAAGLLVPNHGEVFYYDKNIAHMSRAENLEFRREGAFVFQDSALWANQNINQILELPLKIHYPEMNDKQRAQRIKSVTELVGYRKNLNIRPSGLSMGEQKIIGFARAMLCSPSILFLDEWTESLDETSAERLIEIVRRKKGEGTTILFVSHDLRIIKDLADFIIVIVDGKLSLSAPADQIMSDIHFRDFLKIGITS